MLLKGKIASAMYLLIYFFLSVALFEELLILIVEVDDVVDVEVTVEQ